MHYLELALAIIMELIGTNLMKLSNGFTHLCFSLGTLISYGLCFFFLSILNLSITGLLFTIVTSTVSFFIEIIGLLLSFIKKLAY